MAYGTYGVLYGETRRRQAGLPFEGTIFCRLLRALQEVYLCSAQWLMRMAWECFAGYACRTFVFKLTVRPGCFLVLVGSTG